MRAIVRINGAKTTVSTGVKVQVRDWDKKRERCKTDHVANKRLDAAVEEIKIYAGRFKKAPEQVGLPKHKQDILQAIHEYRNRKVQESTSPHTWRAYSTLCANITEFTNETKTPLPRANAIETRYIEDLIAWMREKNYATGHVSKMIRTLRAALRNVAPAQELKTAKPPTAQPKDAVYLTPEEINQVEEIKLSGSLARARDMFLIGLYCGQRFSDWMKITPSRIQQTGTVQTITITQQKTKSRAVVIVTPKIRAIWDRNGAGLPAITNQAFNRAIKEVARLAGISEQIQITEYRMQGERVATYEKWELVSSHTARRSFATNAAIAGIPLQEIMKFTGHKTVSTLLIYLRNTGIETAIAYAEHPFFK